MQETSLVLEDPECFKATKPVRYNYWARALETHELQLLKRSSQESRPCSEKLPQWDAQAFQLENSPSLPQLEKAHMQQDPE